MAETEGEEFGRFQAEKKSLTIQEMTDALDMKNLDEPLLRARGYTMGDWLQLSLGLIDHFEADEYFKVCSQSRLASFLSGKWELDPQRLDCLLEDYGLSKQTLRGLDIRQLMPVENARRDSRLLRRPIVVLERQSQTYCLHGLESVTTGFRMILGRIESGRIDFLHTAGDRSLREAVGAFQKRVGQPLEDFIADKCTELGYANKKEKSHINGLNIPQGSGFGPVDVFVVDRQSGRFVLVEAKNVADEGFVPKVIKEEFREFDDYITKLKSQVAWFAEHMACLKSEFGISPAEEYSVEGVIVVNRPRLWMFTGAEPLPVVDGLRFLELLQKGDKFLTSPITV